MLYNLSFGHGTALLEQLRVTYFPQGHVSGADEGLLTAVTVQMFTDYGSGMYVLICFNISTAAANENLRTNSIQKLDQEKYFFPQFSLNWTCIQDFICMGVLTEVRKWIQMLLYMKLWMAA